MPTLTQLNAIVRRDPTWSDTAFISDANLTTILVEGALDLARRGRALPLVVTFNTVASTQTYTLSGASAKVSNYLDLDWETGAIIYTDANGNIQTHPNNFQIVSEAWLDLNIPSWRSDTASDTLQHVYLTYDGSGNLALGVHPKSSTATPKFDLHYLSRGTDMANSGDFPWVPATLLTHLEDYMKGIAWYALWQLYEQKALLSSLAFKWMSLYLAIAEEMRESQNRIFSTKLMGLFELGQESAIAGIGGTR